MPQGKAKAKKQGKAKAKGQGYRRMSSWKEAMVTWPANRPFFMPSVGQSRGAVKKCTPQGQLQRHWMALRILGTGWRRPPAQCNRECNIGWVSMASPLLTTFSSWKVLTLLTPMVIAMQLGLEQCGFCPTHQKSEPSANNKEVKDAAAKRTISWVHKFKFIIMKIGWSMVCWLRWGQQSLVIPLGPKVVLDCHFCAALDLPFNDPACLKQLYYQTTICWYVWKPQMPFLTGHCRSIFSVLRRIEGMFGGSEIMSENMNSSVSAIGVSEKPPREKLLPGQPPPKSNWFLGWPCTHTHIFLIIIQFMFV